jgi:hypothetical protein
MLHRLLLLVEATPGLLIFNPLVSSSYSSLAKLFFEFKESPGLQIVD